MTLAVVLILHQQLYIQGSVAGKAGVVSESEEHTVYWEDNTYLHSIIVKYMLTKRNCAGPEEGKFC